VRNEETKGSAGRSEAVKEGADPPANEQLAILQRRDADVRNNKGHRAAERSNCLTNTAEVLEIPKRGDLLWAQ